MNPPNTRSSLPSYENSFVRELISLQQDGKEAISGPQNWRKPPLLEVATQSRDEIERLVGALCSKGSNSGEGCWHWLIGSPGNGKSAQLGLLARELLERGFEIVLENGQDALEHTEEATIPYLLHVREPGKSFPIAFLIQDASVVRDPYRESCDPAQDLAEVLDQALDRGVSVLLCTNWGVLQRLFNMGMIDQNARSKAWFRAVREAVERRGSEVELHPTGRRHVFERLAVTFEYLDTRSLLVRSDTLETLVKTATEADRWSVCDRCPSAELCPLKANREDLATDEYRSNVLGILRRAEVLSGQVIVFREAVALISLLLAGCPNDYGDCSPCDWVHRQVADGNVFTLLGRRVPTILFGATTPTGLELEGNSSREQDIRGEQVRTLSAIIELLPTGSGSRRALSLVVGSEPISVDVGVERLVGRFGVLPRLDPSLDPRPAPHIENQVSQLENEPQRGSGIGPLELKCLAFWSEMAEVAESAPTPPEGLGLYFWLRRWQTTCLNRICAARSGTSAMQDELDRYLQFVNGPGDAGEWHRVRRNLETVLEKLLAPEYSAQSSASIALSSTLWLEGRWAAANLRPRLAGHSDQTDQWNAIHVELSSKMDVALPAESFVWLSRRYDLGLSILTFHPDVLDSLRRAQAQAAAASNYSYEPDDIDLVIEDYDGTRRRFQRTGGYLITAEEDGHGAR